MTVLYLLGVLNEFQTFNKDLFKIERLGKLYGSGHDRRLVVALEKLALKKGKVEVAKALHRSCTYTDLIDKFWPIIKRAKNFSRDYIVLGRLTRTLEWLLIREALM